MSYTPQLLRQPYKLLFTLFAFGFLQVGFSQADYFPLGIGHTWIMDSVGNDSIVTDSLILSIVSSEMLESPEQITIYKYTQEISSRLDSTFAYVVASRPNEVIFVDTRDDVLDLDCEFKLHKEYTVGDTLECDGVRRVAEYYGDYVTLQGVLFQDCWIVYDLGGSEPENIYFLAPNVGIISFKDRLDDEFPDTEILSYDLVISSIPEASSIRLSVYPNPSNQFIRLTNLDPRSVDYVYLFDQSGRVVIYEPARADMHMDVSSLESGYYYVAAQKDNRIIWTEKLIIE